MLTMKLFHILASVIAVGLSVSYGFWISAAESKEERLFAARFVRKVEMRITGPLFLVSLVLGVGVQHMSHIPTATTWVFASLVLWLVALGLAHGVQMPALKRLVAALEADRAEEAQAQLARARGAGLGILLTLFSIIGMMVLKPSALLF